VKLEKNASDTCVVLFETYGREALKRQVFFEWHKQFKVGHKNVEDDVPVKFPE
jgi:hypothetical protein